MRLANGPPRDWISMVWNRENAYPILKSNSIRADTASTWRWSKSIGFLAACKICLQSQQTMPCLRTENPYALSMLLNLARLTSSRALPLSASVLTSPPMCSPSRSQSVQMNNALAPVAWALMLAAIALLSCKIVRVNFNYTKWITNLVDLHINRRIKERFWWIIAPFPMIRIEICVSQMAGYTGHNYIAMSPRSPKVEVKCVVLGIRVTSVCLELWIC